MINIHTNLLQEVNEKEMWFLLHLSKYFGADYKKSAFPSNKTLMELTGWRVDKLRGVKDSLTKKGILTVKERFDGDRQTSNIYSIHTEYISFFINIKGDYEEGDPHRKKQQGGSRKNQPLPPSEKPTPMKYYKEEVLKDKQLAIKQFEDVWALFRRKESKADARDYFTAKSRESERGLIKEALVAYNNWYDKKYGSDLSFLLGGNSFFKKERWREFIPTKEEVEAVKIPQITEADGIDSKRLEQLWKMALKQVNPHEAFKSYCFYEKNNK